MHYLRDAIKQDKAGLHIFNMQTVGHPEMLTSQLCCSYRTTDKKYLLTLPLWAETTGFRFSPVLGGINRNVLV